MVKKTLSLRITDRILRLTARRMDRPRRIDRVIDYFGGGRPLVLAPQAIGPRRLARTGA